MGGAGNTERASVQERESTSERERKRSARARERECEREGTGTSAAFGKQLDLVGEDGQGVDNFGQEHHGVLDRHPGKGTHAIDQELDVVFALLALALLFEFRQLCEHIAVCVCVCVCV